MHAIKVYHFRIFMFSKYAKILHEVENLLVDMADTSYRRAREFVEFNPLFLGSEYTTGTPWVPEIIP